MNKNFELYTIYYDFSSSTTNACSLLSLSQWKYNWIIIQSNINYASLAITTSHSSIEFCKIEDGRLLLIFQSFFFWSSATCARCVMYIIIIRINTYTPGEAWFHIAHKQLEISCYINAVDGGKTHFMCRESNISMDRIYFRLDWNIWLIALYITLNSTANIHIIYLLILLYKRQKKCARRLAPSHHHEHRSYTDFSQTNNKIPEWLKKRHSDRTI